MVAALKDLNKLYGEAEKAVDKYDARVQEANEAQRAWEEEGETLAEMYGETVTDAIEETAAATDTLSKAMTGDADAISEVEAAVKNANDALQALADYQQNVRDQVDQTVKSVVNGFSKIVTPAQKALNEVADLTKALEKRRTKKSGQNSKSRRRLWRTPLPPSTT